MTRSEESQVIIDEQHDNPARNRRNVTKPATNDSTPPTEPPKKRRTRGPNKPKTTDVHIEVRTEAVINQAEIVKLLTNHVKTMLGDEAAVGMELQIGKVTANGSIWAPSDGSIVRFATKGMR